jgi:hypothetical protein
MNAFASRGWCLTPGYEPFGFKLASTIAQRAEFAFLAGDLPDLGTEQVVGNMKPRISSIAYKGGAQMCSQDLRRRR